jgi:hypothetical protein
MDNKNKDGRKVKEIITFSPLSPSFISILSSKIRVSDSLRSSNSNISEAKLLAETV